MIEFEEEILSVCDARGDQVRAWCILPNHYHLLVFCGDVLATVAEMGRLHGRTAFKWNGEDRSRGRKVWYNCVDRAIRSDGHFWATMNYVHHQPIHHGYSLKWEDWPFSSADRFLASYGRDRAAHIWNEFPILDYGKDWDPPSL